MADIEQTCWAKISLSVFLYLYLFISPSYEFIIIFGGNKDLDHIFDSLANRYHPEQGFSLRSC
jgi:hypothetical protein